jgi:hypothetical protein
MRLIPDEAVQAAFDYLDEHAAQAGAAAAERERSHYGLKIAFGRLFSQAPEGSVAAKEAWVHAHIDYQAAVDAHCAAVKRHEDFRNRNSKASAIIDAWRTQSSNQRTMGRVA